MKKPVDIHKLVEEKYAKSNDSLRILYKHIDAILEATNFGYTTKVNTEELEEISQSEDVFDHAFGMGGAENQNSPEKGYQGTEPSEVVPDKLTMEGESDSSSKSSTALQTTTAYDFKAIDFFTLISNSKMEMSDEDRQLINDVIENISGGEATNWRQRIQAIKEFSSMYGNMPAKEPLDIKKAVSAIIYLNLLKKLSFFTAQPGKQFEYVFAPLIDPNAYVVGANNTNIVDAALKGGEGGWGLKFFTAAAGFEATGSREGLFLQKKGLPYIMARAVEGGIIEFVEVMFTAHLDIIPNGYFKMAENSSAVFFRKSHGGSQVADPTQPDFYCYVKTMDQKLSFKKEKEQNVAAKKSRKTNESLVYEAPEDDPYARFAKPPEGFELEKTRRQNPARDSFNIYGRKIQRQNFHIIKRDIIGIETKLKNELKKPKPDLNAVLEEIGKKFQDFKDRTDKIIKDSEITDQLKYQHISDMLGAIESTRQQIDSKYIRNLNIPTTSSAQTTQTEVVPETEKGQFAVPLKEVWNSLGPIRMNLGNTNKLNSHLIDLTTSINKAVGDLFKELEQMMKSITRFFATSKAKSGDSGQRAITHSKNVYDKLTNIVPKL